MASKRDPFDRDSLVSRSVKRAGIMARVRVATEVADLQRDVAILRARTLLSVFDAETRESVRLSGLSDVDVASGLGITTEALDAARKAGAARADTAKAEEAAREAQKAADPWAPLADTLHSHGIPAQVMFDALRKAGASETAARALVQARSGDVVVSTDTTTPVVQE